jgi:hypothetical protein
LRPFSFCFRTYVATVHACDTGTAIRNLPPSTASDQGTT